MPRGYPDHYRNTNRVSFPRELTEADALWWEKAVLDKAGVYPDTLPDFLASGVPGSVIGTYTTFDSQAEVFELALRSLTEEGSEIVFKNKRFEVSGGLINDGETKVHPDWQERGIGTLLMMNLIDFGDAIGAKRIEIEAQAIGRYAWLHMGFLPDRTSWKEKIAPVARTFADLQLALGTITREVRDEVLDIASKADPRFARELVALGRFKIPGYDRRGQPSEIPLTKGIMLQPGTEWNGSFEFDDDSLDLFKEYREGHNAKFGRP